MGYVRETRLIAKRAREMRGAWSDHIAATQSVIERSIEACQNRGTVVIVGSGNLLDIPLDTLSKSFQTVVLLDIYHSPATRLAVQSRSNVQVIAADVTGIARPVYLAARSGDVGELPKSRPPSLGLSQIDLIVSVNVLSQLAVIPCNFLRGHRPSLPTEQLGSFARDLIDTHLQWLTTIARHSCLITDVLRIETLSNGSQIEKDIIEGVKLPEPDDLWDWAIAPRGSIFRDREVVHRVHGYLDLPRETGPE